MTFAFTMLFMVLVFWRPQDWLFPWLFGVPLLDGVVYAALLALLLERQQGKAQLPRTPAVVLIVGLWGATILSHVPHTYFQGILDTIPYTFKPCFYTLLLLMVINATSRARFVALVFVGMGLVMALHALAQERTGAGLAGQPPMWVLSPQTGEWYSRSIFFGIFEDPNDLAQMLAAAIPFAFAVPRRLGFLGFAVSIGLAVLLFMAALATHSRGGMVALLASVWVVAILLLPSRWLPWLIAVGLLAFLVACGTLGARMMDQSARDRVVYWGMANRMFKANPINMMFGIGFGMFWRVASDRCAHNAFVACYTEIGLIGYWFWFGLLQLGVLGCWRARVALRGARDPESSYLRRLAGLSVASLVGYCAGAYFLSRTFVFPIFFLFGLMNAIPAIAQDLLPADHPSLVEWGRDVLTWGTVTTIGSVLYIYGSILILNLSSG